jgi:hypothetical protein
MLNCVEMSVILIRRKIYWVCTATYPRISKDLTMLFLLVKVLKGPIYANRLADFASVFKDRQKEIRMALLLHTATSLDSVRDTLADVDQSVRLTGEKLNMIALFHKLDSLEEKELMKQVEARGGALKCMEDDSALTELISVRKKLEQDQRQGEPEQTGPSKDMSAHSVPPERLRTKSRHYNVRIRQPSLIHPHSKSHAHAHTYAHPPVAVPGTRVHSQSRDQVSFSYTRSSIRPAKQIVSCSANAPLAELCLSTRTKRLLDTPALS